MGCDIHTIVEIKENGNWKCIDEVPEQFNKRDYKIFALLANVRNYFDIKGFEPKGLPEDISGKKFYFESYTEQNRVSFKSDEQGRTMFIRDDGVMLDPTDIPEEGLTKEEYDKLSNIPKEELEAFRRQYYSLGYSLDGKTKEARYTVRNAYSHCGHFEQVPYYKVFGSFDEYMKYYHEDDWDEEMQDYGKWKVNFECGDYHSASYLTLYELLNSYTDYYAYKCKVDAHFYKAFTEFGGKLPKEMTCDKFEPQTLTDVFQEAFSPNVIVTWWYTEEEKKETPLYTGTEKLIEIAKKHNIVDYNNIRLVFAFDN